MAKHVYSFGGKSADGDGKMKELLGGKGANLAEMCKIGIPVPPGFTITTEVCAAFYDNGKKIPEAAIPEINDALARTYFRDQDPVGVRITFDRVPDSTSTWRTIVGVVGSERQSGVATEPVPEFLAPYAQEPRNSMTLVLRTRGDPAAFGPAVRQIVKALDPTLAITALRTMNDVPSSR